MLSSGPLFRPRAAVFTRLLAPPRALRCLPFPRVIASPSLLPWYPRDVVGVTLVACWSSPQPPAKSWWEPGAATGGRGVGEGGFPGGGSGGGGLWPSWGAFLASISRRWLRVARARPAARTRPRPPPFSGVSVSGSDTRSQGRGGFLHPPCVSNPSFSVFISLYLSYFPSLFFLFIPISLIFRSFPFANRCLSLARVATFGVELRGVHPVPCGLYGRLRVSSYSSSSCSPVFIITDYSCSRPARVKSGAYHDAR